MNRIVALIGGALLGIAIPSSAQTISPPASAEVQSSAAPSVDGEVRRVDKEQGKITLKHGPITNLEMPAMTMVFRVKDPAMLDKVKEGDKVRFTANKVGGNFTVTSIEAAR
ncbi:MAG: copper-binding protein [Betaproteobacteria bacterium]